MPVEIGRACRRKIRHCHYLSALLHARGLQQARGPGDLSLPRLPPYPPRNLPKRVRAQATDRLRQPRRSGRRPAC